MSDFKNAPLGRSALEPEKRVNPTLGMVLNEDDYRQEQTFFLQRDNVHQRLLHGYGVAFGLAVRVLPGTGGPEVTVDPGRAVAPGGQTIHLEEAQCAELGTWLQGRAAEIDSRFGTPPGGPVRVYVRLTYREVETDFRPVASGPCAKQDDATAASRIAASYRLALAFDPPSQDEEDAVRLFGELVNDIVISSEAADPLTADDLSDRVRDLAASPPSGGDLYLHPDTACEALRAALHTWISEVRPALLGADGAAPLDNSLVVAALDFDLAADLSVIGGDAGVAVAYDETPVLASTRLLEEVLRCLRRDVRRPERSFATLDVSRPDTVHAWVHVAEVLSIPASAVSLTVNGTAVNFTLTQQAGPNVFALQLGGALQNDDLVEVVFDAAQIVEQGGAGRFLPELADAGVHSFLDRQGDLITAYLVADLPALDDLTDVNAPNPANGELLTFNGGAWGPAPPDVPALGDLTDVNTAGSDNGEVLTFNNGVWGPAAAQGGVPLEDIARDLPTIPFVTITPAPIVTPVDPSEVPAVSAFILWFHLNVDKLEQANLPQLAGGFDVEVFSELESAPGAGFPYLQQLTVQNIQSIIDRNAFRISLGRAPDPDFRPYMRFRFDLANMFLGTGESLLEFLEQRPIKWLGHEGGEFLTAFFHNRRVNEVVAAGVFENTGEGLVRREDLWGGIRVTGTFSDLEFDFRRFNHNVRYMVKTMMVNKSQRVGTGDVHLQFLYNDFGGVHMALSPVDVTFESLMVEITAIA